jgi:CHASE2 domain-containing sensor protein
MRFLPGLKPRYKTMIGGLTVGAAITLLVLQVLQGLSIFSNAELSWYDWQFNHRGAIAPSSQIVIVGVDQSAFNNLPPYTNPLRRYWVGQALTFLCHAHARAVGIDFSYAQRSVHDVYTGGADSRALGTAVRSCGRAVLNEQIEGAGADSRVAGQSLAPPIAAIAPDGKPWVHTGVANVPLDSDYVVREAWNLQSMLDSSRKSGLTDYPTFPVVLASVACPDTC